MHPVDYLKTDRWRRSPWHVSLTGAWVSYHRAGRWYENMPFVEVWWRGPSTVQKTNVLVETRGVLFGTNVQWEFNVYQN